MEKGATPSREYSTTTPRPLLRGMAVHSCVQGARVKLPSRKGREGKVLGRIPARDESDDEKRKEGTDNLVLRDADSAERSGFRALFSTKKEDSLAAAAPFAGQVRQAAIMCVGYISSSLNNTHRSAVRVCSIARSRAWFDSPDCKHIQNTSIQLLR